jgi:hypothetical protein
MSSTSSDTSRPQPRVRHQARDAVVLMVFSAGMSVSLTVVMTLLLAAGQRG